MNKPKAMKFKKINLPKEGEIIQIDKDKPSVPDKPIIPFIEGDGIGPEIMRASLKVWDAAIKKAYSQKRKIFWLEIYAGEKAESLYSELLPEETLEAIKYLKIGIKGPLTTPVGGGYRSLNVSLRQELDLYACVRPVYYFQGVPSPVVHPEKMDIVIFRENTEDVYAGIEWKKGSPEAKRVISFLEKEFGIKVREDSGIGIKPISETATKRLVRKALQYAIQNKRKSLTLVHKGNIMKFTEGAFKEWGYSVAKEEFADYIITEEELFRLGAEARGLEKTRIVLKDRIADAMFQQILARPQEYDVIALPNLNGDYLSDACAAQIGGLGMAPGGNIGDRVALFEACHGSAPKYANQNKANPCALILSGVMLLEYLGWSEPATFIKQAIAKTILQKRVTYDLARLMEDVKPISTSDFALAVIENL